MNRKILVFGMAALLAVILLSPLLSRGTGEPGAAQQDASITVLNAQSYPAVGGNWTVAFSTAGASDLVITAVNGTSYGRDLDFLELRCGDAVVPVQLLRDGSGSLLAVRAGGWRCDNSTAYLTVKVLSIGSHTQQLTFGSQKALAHNIAFLLPNSSVCSHWRKS